jgi:hypothetical protein
MIPLLKGTMKLVAKVQVLLRKKFWIYCPPGLSASCPIWVFITYLEGISGIFFFGDPSKCFWCKMLIFSPPFLFVCGGNPLLQCLRSILYNLVCLMYHVNLTLLTSQLPSTSISCFGLQIYFLKEKWKAFNLQMSSNEPTEHGVVKPVTSCNWYVSIFLVM